MKKRNSTALKLTVIALAMFGFGFALIPIYNLVCNITGLNGKTGIVQTIPDSQEIDSSRLITVEFIAILNQSMPMTFSPEVKKMQVNPGDTYEVEYIAQNKTNATMTGQAVPSLSPTAAAAHFNKIECFCFTKQNFAAGETRRLLVQFIISPKLPKYIKTVSLAYTFFDVTEKYSQTL